MSGRGEKGSYIAVSGRSLPIMSLSCGHECHTLFHGSLAKKLCPFEFRESIPSGVHFLDTKPKKDFDMCRGRGGVLVQKSVARGPLRSGGSLKQSYPRADQGASLIFPMREPLVHQVRMLEMHPFLVEESVEQREQAEAQLLAVEMTVLWGKAVKIK
eukprot:scaffold5491_cov132-Cylindrotheca_fusiformis.AAC.1